MNEAKKVIGDAIARKMDRRLVRGVNALTEAQLKTSVAEYLTYQQNLGRLVFLRLNSGDFIVTNEGGTFRRRIKGCPAGTADFVVVKGDIDTMLRPRCSVIFLELKSEKGRTSPEQNAFKILVENQGSSYFVIRSIEELETIFGGA